MSGLIAHRGPDGSGIWNHPRGHVGFAHRRLTIIDLDTGEQPMTDESGNWITYNGEIYNYLELRRELGGDSSATTSDTEVVLRAYDRWGAGCARPPARDVRLRALGRARADALLRARPLRDQAVLLRRGRRRPVLRLRGQGAAAVPAGDRDRPRRRSRTTSAFQFCLGGKTLFKGVRELLPGHCLRVRERQRRAPRATGRSTTSLDFDHTPSTSRSASRELSTSRSRLHLRARRAGRRLPQRRARLEHRRRRSLHADRTTGMTAFTGRFPRTRGYDESRYARDLADRARARRCTRSTSAPRTSSRSIERVIYHLDYPVAGPGSFPQYMVSAAAAQRSQGGARRPGRRRDLRRLRALPDRLLRAVHQGRDRRHDARRQLRRHLRVDHPEPHGRSQEYKPLLQEFWQRRAVRGPRRALLPARSTARRTSATRSTGSARRLLAVRDVPGRSSTATTSARSRTSTR